MIHDSVRGAFGTVVALLGLIWVAGMAVAASGGTEVTDEAQLRKWVGGWCHCTMTLGTDDDPHPVCPDPYLWGQCGRAPVCTTPWFVWQPNSRVCVIVTGCTASPANCPTRDMGFCVFVPDC